MDSGGQVRQTKPQPTEPAGALRHLGGQFRSRALEETFVAEQAAENHRHARVLLIASVLLNTLFVASDWRFHGTPHFWVAIPARAVVVAAALAGLALLRVWSSPGARQRIMVGWMAVNGLGVAALTSSHSDIAMLVVVMLPVIYYLAVPVSLAWTLAGGIGCSAVLLAGYEYGSSAAGTSLGLMLALLILNVALTIVMSRWNRLQRMGWLAMREMQRIGTELAASREQTEKIFAASPVPLIAIAVADGCVLRFNDSLVELMKGSPEDTGSADASDFHIEPVDRTRLLEQIERDGYARDFETRLRLIDGSERTVLITANVVDISTGRVILAGIIDISGRKAAEHELARLAATDPLTGLPNRLSFFSAGRDEIARAAPLGTPLALLMIDLDHFKQVNDNFGHLAGDEALRRFAATCRELIGERGVAARLGGEEFGVLVRDADLGAAERIAEQLRMTVERMTIVYKRTPIQLTASIGVAVVDPRDRALDRALARADAALYRAKHRGRNRVVVAGATVFRRAG